MQNPPNQSRIQSHATRQLTAVTSLLPATCNLLLFFLISTLAFTSCQPVKEKPSLTAACDSLFAAVPDFSGVALVADHGKPIYHKAFGYIDFNTQIANDTSTIFELASVSKQFTGVIIMMLKEEGKLDYDDPMEKYIDGLPYPGITIRHLLTHTSGLPDYQKVMDEHWDKTKQAANEEIIAYLKQYHPEKLAEPGEKYEYSNTGYVMLGTIAEKASGTDFLELARRRIFAPVGMSSTDIRTIDEKALIKNFALGHIYVAEKAKYIRADSFPATNYIYWLGKRRGPGRISSTTSDLLKWDQQLYTENLIKKETLADAFLPFRLKNDSISNYGFGWTLRSAPPFGKIVMHTGSNPGYNTVIIRFLEVNKTIILLCNNAHPQFKEISQSLEQILAHY